MEAKESEEKIVRRLVLKSLVNRSMVVDLTDKKALAQPDIYMKIIDCTKRMIDEGWCTIEELTQTRYLLSITKRGRKALAAM